MHFFMDKGLTTAGCVKIILLWKGYIQNKIKKKIKGFFTT